ncbi:MAG: response regulator [Gemmatimonadetes bacterium]|nr:response regulator [Gemmatimonadota bacterium]
MRFSRYADMAPLAVFVILVGFLFVLDREWSGRAERRLDEARQVADSRVRAVADVLGNEVSARIGSVEAAKSSFITAGLPNAASEAEARVIATLDSMTTRLEGLTSMVIIDPVTHQILRAPGTGLGRMIDLNDPPLRLAFLRAIANRRRAASDVVDYGFGRRVFVFDPLMSSDSAEVVAVIAAELDPQWIYRVAMRDLNLDSIGEGASSHVLFGPDSVALTTVQQVPASWETVSRDVRVADTAWRVKLSYPPPDLRAYRAERAALWVAGLALAVASLFFLLFLRRTIRTQKEEIARRQAAEDSARTAAEEARVRAKEARELAQQLGAAQDASQRLSTSLDPNDVVEQFLGGVAEILGADVASLYTFEEEGELLVGRRRMVFRDIEGITDRLKHEDIRQVRAPVALLPALGEAVSTGEPYVIQQSDDEGRLLASRGAGPDAPASSVTVPLLIAGHTVGVASWEVYTEARRFPPSLVAFAQALAAPAAAALRTAELFLSLDTEQRSAAHEAVRFGAVLDHMADGVIVVDADGRVERSNAAAEELLGKDLADTPVEEWPVRFDLVSVEGRSISPSEFPLIRAMHGEQVRRATFIVRSDWGAERYLSCSAGPVQAAGTEVAGAAMVLRDVTDEHQYAEMLRHTNRELRRQAEVLELVNQQLREATKAKDQFLAVMSHELRTPINAIMGYSDLLDLGVKGPLNDDQRGMLNRVRETSRHLLGLINEVLDLAKIGAGRMDLVLVELNVEEIVERAAQQIMPQATEKGLSLEVRGPDGDEAVCVNADETRLTQIVINLLSNAVKFTSSGGVTISYAEIDGHVAVRVTDTGPGIPSDQADRIFEEFYQVEGGLSRASGGTGLGLAIARRFARLMGGDVRVESDYGNGSTFIILLPTVEQKQGESANADETKVVVLMHNDRAVDRLREDLSGTLSVVGATDPSQFALLARRESPHLLALDARAPDYGAWRAVAAMQAEVTTSKIPMVLFAHQDDMGETAIDLGFLTTLSKPISVGAATDMVRAMGGHRPVSVLITDDDPDVRRILGEALSAAGCEVHTASSGAEALEMARRLEPAVALIDLLMPGMDGIEAIAAIRSEPSLHDVRVIAILSREMAEEEMERLTASIAAIGRGHRARTLATAEILRHAAEAGVGDAPSGAAA